MHATLYDKEGHSVWVGREKCILEARLYCMLSSNMIFSYLIYDFQLKC